MKLDGISNESDKAVGLSELPVGQRGVLGLPCCLDALCCTGAAVVNARKVSMLAAAGTVQCWCC
jgi:hypothetical protein